MQKTPDEHKRLNRHLITKKKKKTFSIMKGLDALLQGY